MPTLATSLCMTATRSTGHARSGSGMRSRETRSRWSLSSTALTRDDPRLREQAVRMLGRDCRENGHVEYQKPEAKQPPAALKHLDTLLAMADDPDAGVRRELILALRNLPTDKVGDALRKLAASWDGQDRWYLEALGLALENRESAYLSQALRRHALWRARPRPGGQGKQGRASAVFPGRPQRGVYRRPARPTCRQAPSARIWGWRGGSIGARSCRCSSASCPTCERPSCNRPPTTSWSG